jgi:mannose-6-phosphate isomerase-like protein (cupin superfamily)
MNIHKLSDADVMKNAHGVDLRNLYDAETAYVSVLTLRPGEQLKRHITPVDVAFYILEGQGIVEIGEEKMSVGKDTLIESPKDIPHCWYNESGGNLRVLIIKAPKPRKKTLFVD